MGMTIHSGNAPALPAYWEEAKTWLMQHDRVMHKLIGQCGNLQLVGRSKPFVTLVRAIIGQQLSIKAAEAVWNRFLAACPACTPTEVMNVGDKLTSCGLSKRKTEYLLGLAEHFQAKRVQCDQWAFMADEEVIADLMQIRGIGRWTAEMFLIFNLLRPNILPLDDAGLLASISRNYFSGEPVSRSDAREVAANWAPYRTVATWYLWRSLAPIPVSY